MPSDKRILITGGTGLLARGMEETAPAGWDITGVHLRGYPMKGSRTRHLVADVRDREAVRALFERERFDVVVHAAGLASVDHIESHPEEGRVSNVEGTRNVAEECRRRGVYMVYISTNAVFDGTRAPYREDAPTAPPHHYGRIKLECERLVGETAGPHAVARPILMYGWNHPMGRPNPVVWVYEKLRRGEAVQLVDDVFENPLHNHQCGRALWAMAERRPGGVFHLAGADRVNRYELGLRTAKAFGLSAALIRPVPSSFFPAIAPRPKDTTFVTERMERELGVPPVSLEEGLGAMKSAPAG